MRGCSLASTSSKSSGALRRSRHCRHHSFRAVPSPLALGVWLGSASPPAIPVAAEIFFPHDLHCSQHSSSASKAPASVGSPRAFGRGEGIGIPLHGSTAEHKMLCRSQTQPPTSRRHLDNSRLPSKNGGHVSHRLATPCHARGLLESHEQRSAPEPQSVLGRRLPTDPFL